MLSAQPQFVNHDFEQSSLGQGCQSSRLGLDGWTFNAPNRGGICNSEKVCNGNISLEFAAYNGGWKATTLNPMSGNSLNARPYTVQFKCSPGFINGTNDYIKAYGTQYINGPETFLGEVEVAQSDAPCTLKAIDMPATVSEFMFFVLKMEDTPGVAPAVSSTCVIDDIEVLNLCTREFPEYTVQQNTNWQTIADVEEDIPGSTFGGEVYLSGLNIDSYKKLTIGGGIKIHFSNGALLLMWDGSELDLYGTLTSCDNRWGGVRIYGSAHYRSFYDSELSNAVWGISTEEWGNNLGALSIIECKDALFLNNAVSIHLYAPFLGGGTQFGYVLDLENCAFKKDANFDPTGRFWGFISLSNVTLASLDGSLDNIRGCSFKDFNPTDQFNFGIEAFTSDFFIGANNGSRTVFQNLGYGIFANRLLLSDVYNVRSTDFNDCAIGIANRRVLGGIAVHNTFNMGNMDPVHDGLLCCNGFNLQVGISNNGTTTGYDIESNRFQNTTGNAWAQGVNNYNIGIADNRVYLDTFVDMRHGNSAGNAPGFVNAQANVFGTGLHYLCNENQNNNTNGTWNWGIDFFSRDNLSVRVSQGELTPLNYGPARNTFSQGANNSWHFYNFSAQNTTIQYYAQLGAANEVPDNAKLNNVVSQAIQALPNGCPQNYFRTQNPRKKWTVEEKANYESQYITVFQAVSASKDAYQAAKLTGDKAQEAIKGKEFLFHQGEMEKIANKGLRNALWFKSGSDRNEIRLWMKRMHNRTGDMILADDYVGTGEYNKAMQVLNQIEMEYDLNNNQMIDLENIRDIYEMIQNESIEQLNANSLKKLMDMADSEAGQACELAKSILAVKGVYYPTTIIFDKELASQNGFDTSTSQEYPIKMSVSPNPADYNVDFDWSDFMVMDGQSVRIEITNKMGGLLKLIVPANGISHFEWTTEGVSSGICYYRLVIGAQVKDTGYILISK